MATEDYDVFLSFRGEIRRNFTCHVSTELKRKRFKPFMDCESIGLGDEIQETIDKAIKHSKSAIVILSDEYASSKHCLNELVLILEQKYRTSKYFIIPIFYYVNTDDVKHQSGKFGAAFEHIKKQQHGDDKVKEWITSFSSIGGILGKEIKEHNGLMESTIIEDILATFEQKFNDHYPERLQHTQVMPPTTSTVLNIDESTSRFEDTRSSRTEIKGWKIKCKKFGRELSTCVCVCISFLIILISISQFQQHSTGVPTLGPPPPLPPPPPPPFSTSIPLYKRYVPPRKNVTRKNVKNNTFLDKFDENNVFWEGWRKIPFGSRISEFAAFTHRPPPAFFTPSGGWVTVPPPPAFFTPSRGWVSYSPPSGVANVSAVGSINPTEILKK